MRGMIDEEKKGALEELLKQLYAKLGGTGEEASAEETPVGEKVAEAEGEEMAEEMTEEPKEEGLSEMIGDFMKNRHKPKMGKGVGVMMAKITAKPMKKVMK